MNNLMRWQSTEVRNGRPYCSTYVRGGPQGVMRRVGFKPGACPRFGAPVSGCGAVAFQPGVTGPLAAKQNLVIPGIIGGSSSATYEGGSGVYVAIGIAALAAVGGLAYYLLK